MVTPCPKAPLGKPVKGPSIQLGHLRPLPQSQYTNDTRQSKKMSLGYPKPPSARGKAFLRGDLAHEFLGPDHKPTSEDLTMQEFADGWGVDLEEAQRRFTHFRMNNPQERSRRK